MNRMGLEVRFCAIARAKAMCWMSARRGEALLCGPARILSFCSAPASVRRQSCRCCMHSPQKNHSGRSGGSMERAIATEHPFAQESRSLLKQLSGGQSYIVYSRPAATDQLGWTSMLQGMLNVALLEKLGVPRDGDFYLCGPSSFLQSMREGLRSLGGARRQRAHGNLRRFGRDYAWCGAGRTYSAPAARARRTWSFGVVRA